MFCSEALAMASAPSPLSLPVRQEVESGIYSRQQPGI